MRGVVDLGVAGPQAIRVSASYNFFFAGANGVPLTMREFPMTA